MSSQTFFYTYADPGYDMKAIMDKAWPHKPNAFLFDGVGGRDKSALDRRVFSSMLSRLKDGDSVVCLSIHDFGGNTAAIARMIDAVLSKGCRIVFVDEGIDSKCDSGLLAISTIMKIAAIEKKALVNRQMRGIEAARKAGRRMGREKVIDDKEVVEWRVKNEASISQTAKHFGISTPSVKRAMKKMREAEVL